MDGNADTTSDELSQLRDVVHYRFDISLGMDPKQDPNAVNEDFDDASPDNIKRVDGKAATLAIAPTLQEVIAELRKPSMDVPIIISPSVSALREIAWCSRLGARHMQIEVATAALGIDV